MDNVNNENKNKINIQKGSKILPESFLNKIFELTEKYKLYNPIKILQIYNKSIKEEYKDFKQKISLIENINIANSKILYKKCVEKELMEVGVFILSKSKNKPKHKIPEIKLKELSKEIKLERKKMKNNQKICPFCSKSFIHTNRHFFGVRKSSKGCNNFYDSLLSLKNIKDQMYLYFQTFKYLYDSLANLEYNQFQKIVKKNRKKNKIEYKLLVIRSLAIKFSKYLHKLFDTFKVISKKNKEKKKLFKVVIANDNIKTKKSEKNKMNENNESEKQLVKESENLEKKNPISSKNLELNYINNEKINDNIIKKKKNTLNRNFIINQIPYDKK